MDCGHILANVRRQVRVLEAASIVTGVLSVRHTVEGQGAIIERVCTRD